MNAPPIVISAPLIKDPGSILSIYTESPELPLLQVISSVLIQRALSVNPGLLQVLLDSGFLPVALSIFPGGHLSAVLRAIVTLSVTAARWLVECGFLRSLSSVIGELSGDSLVPFLELAGAFGGHQELEGIFPELVFVLCSHVGDESAQTASAALDAMAALLGGSAGCCQAVLVGRPHFVTDLVEQLRRTSQGCVRRALFRVLESSLKHHTEMLLDWEEMVSVLVETLGDDAFVLDIAAGVRAIAAGCGYGPEYVRMCFERGTVTLLKTRLRNAHEWTVMAEIVRCLSAMVMNAAPEIAVGIVGGSDGLWEILMDVGGAFAFPEVFDVIKFVVNNRGMLDRKSVV
jgi:hypothetical protein